MRMGLHAELRHQALFVQNPDICRIDPWLVNQIHKVRFAHMCTYVRCVNFQWSLSKWSEWHNFLLFGQTQAALPRAAPLCRYDTHVRLLVLHTIRQQVMHLNVDAPTSSRLLYSRLYECRDCLWLVYCFYYNHYYCYRNDSGCLLVASSMRSYLLNYPPALNPAVLSLVQLLLLQKVRVWAALNPLVYKHVGAHSDRSSVTSNSALAVYRNGEVYKVC